MSGAGKSRAIDALEDIGFYCVDNIPPQLIGRIAEIAMAAGGALSRIAVVTDMRGGKLFYGLFREMDALKAEGLCCKLLFLDASDAELIRRYKETRRRHPLADSVPGGLSAQIAAERTAVAQARERADYVIDTTCTSASELRQRLNAIFTDGIRNTMLVSVMSFGFKHGLPVEADLVFDVRCLPNPYYVPALKEHTGLEQQVRDYVMNAPESVELLRKLRELVEFLVPLYQKEGKTQLMIAVGCTGGHHRSVTFAEYLYEDLAAQGHNVRISHRDIEK
jgi:UPF0042 nucleotide-binding protein